jgi:hypothetical protein
MARFFIVLVLLVVVLLLLLFDIVVMVDGVPVNTVKLQYGKEWIMNNE